jgi:hypothetical protein
MVFNIARHILFRRLGWNDYGDEQIQAVVTEISALTRSALNLQEAP